MSAFILPASLMGQVREGRSVNAYLFTGAGDEALEPPALALAAALLCEGTGKSGSGSGGEGADEGGERPCGACKSCRKVEKGVHPDLQIVEKLPDKTQLTVEQVRKLRSEAYVRPNEAPRKVYLLRRAWQMNDEAQNAFLKVLEEGPAYAVFLLLSPNPSALLPTIRSRCQQVNITAAAQVDPELERRAGELAGLLLGDDPWRRISWCVAWEKAKREEVIPLWQETRRALLTYRTPRTTAKAVELAQCLEELLAAAPSGNLGVLWGRLWAQAG